MTATLRYVGSRFVDPVPDPLGQWITENVDDDVWGVVQTSTRRSEGELWLVVTRSQNALAAASHDGRCWEHLPMTGVTETRTKLTQQEFLVDERVLFSAGRLGSGKRERLFELAFLRRPDGVFAAARDHIDAKQWSGADELLELAESLLTDDDRQGSVAFLSLEQKIHLAQAHCAMELGREGDAVVMLAAVSDDRPGDDLLRATEEQHSIDGWLLTLALAHEEAQRPGSAARVYARLHEAEPEADVLLLSRARALARSGEREESVRAYEEFVQRRERHDVVLSVDAAEAADVAAACLESARLLQELGRPTEAAEKYLTMIRHAPFEAEGYRQLFALRDDLDDDWSITIASEVLRFLDPNVASDVASIAPAHEPFDLPHPYRALPDDDHDDKIVHRGERDSSTLAQRWIGALTRDERDTRDIERHAQRVDDEAVLTTLEAVAKLVGVPTPRIYLSGGTAGVEVLGAEDPFVLLGACHIDPGDDQHLTGRELTFTLAAQVEHIRADHVLLTSSEFWRTFGTKSATTLLAFVPLGDVISRFTDGKLLKWVKKLSGSSSSAIRSAVELVEKRIAAGATGEGVQSAYTATLAKLRSSALEQPDDASLVKERLAEFARAAQYTADRVGLLACDDIRTAVAAMVRLSPSLQKYGDTLASDGFSGLLEAAREEPALEELVLRVGELLRFALSDDYATLRAKISPPE